MRPLTHHLLSFLLQRLTLHSSPLPFFTSPCPRPILPLIILLIVTTNASRLYVHARYPIPSHPIRFPSSASIGSSVTSRQRNESTFAPRHGHDDDDPPPRCITHIHPSQHLTSIRYRGISRLIDHNDDDDDGLAHHARLHIAFHSIQFQSLGIPSD
jgi:hypothetical protein